MFFYVFSLVFRSDVVFLKTKNRTVVVLILGGPNVVISLVLGMILAIHVFRSCVFNEFLSRFRWGIICIGGPKSSKQWKSFCESDNCCFLGFFDSLDFRGQSTKILKVEVHLALLHISKHGDCHEQMKVGI